MFPNQKPTPATGKMRPKPWEKNFSERQQQQGGQPASQDFDAGKDNQSVAEAAGCERARDTKVSFSTEVKESHPASLDEPTARTQRQVTPFANGENEVKGANGVNGTSLHQGVRGQGAKDDFALEQAPASALASSGEESMSAAERMEKMADAMMEEEAGSKHEEREDPHSAQA